MLVCSEHSSELTTARKLLLATPFSHCLGLEQSAISSLVISDTPSTPNKLKKNKLRDCVASKQQENMGCKHQSSIRDHSLLPSMYPEVCSVVCHVIDFNASQSTEGRWAMEIWRSWDKNICCCQKFSTDAFRFSVT